ncbi:FAD-dependent monooxygenase [Phytoactinopolyspora limicola]|uniref:FAD-dependent monooxygenase n=1 Tax=Phytoactinopolyspora limicola TaxID=2715536 RepID=UPI00140C4CE6|nr:FAD-dependent monooxygenase [Phytoactinopolyspora limicola]
MDADVVVVGAGPVGLLVAGELRLGGADVVVVDRLAAPMTESRASTIHARTMEILDQRGLLDRLGAPPGIPVGHFGGIPLDLSGQPSRFAGQWKVPQADLERVLTQWVHELGVRIRRGHDVRVLVPGADEVEVGAHTSRGPVRLRAAYVVGCDGDDSAVRRLAPFEFPGAPATRELFRCDVTGVDVPDHRFERFPDGLAISATRNGVTRVMVHEFGHWPAHRASPPEFTEVAAAWKRVTGEDISGGTAIWVNAFDNSRRQVARYRQGRVLLAGDAAHRQMPVGGQALNLGLQDAANLGWKLAAEVTGWAPAGLLDSYHGERHPAGQAVLDAVEAQAHLLLGGPEVEAVRAFVADLLDLPDVHDRLATQVGGLDVRYQAGTHPLDGARVPQVELATEEGRTTTTDLLRGGRGVLLDLSGDRARADHMRRLVTTAAGPISAVCGTAPDPSPLAGAATVLVRPDGHVAWAGDHDSDPGAALRRWFGGR